MLEIILIIIACIILRVLVYVTRSVNISHPVQHETASIQHHTTPESSVTSKRATLLRILEGNPDDPSSIAYYRARRKFHFGNSHNKTESEFISRDALDLSAHQLFSLFMTKSAPDHTIEKICHRLD